SVISQKATLNGNNNYNNSNNNSNNNDNNNEKIENYIEWTIINLDKKENSVLSCIRKTNKAVTEAVRCEELCLWLHTPIFRHNICPFRLRRNLLACTGFHLTGQLAILKCRVKEFLKNNHDSHGRVRQMILRHYRLISIRKMSLQKITYPPRTCFRLADTSEDSFNIVTCLHMSLARSEKVYIFTFLIYFCLLLCTLYSYCYDGQCLIEECDAIYRCDWYELSTIDLKSLCISMVRAGKPLQLTGAKFGVVSSCTFTDVNHSEDIDGVLISSTNIYANKRENDIEEQLKSKRFRRDKLKSRYAWISTSKTRNANDFKKLVRKVTKSGKIGMVLTDQYSGINSREFEELLKEEKIL
ncbi:odorant receptor 13a-like, partial [Vespula squamosa]